MLAWCAHDYGSYRDVLRLETMVEPEPPRGGVVVEVAAIGLSFFDILSIAGKYQVKVPTPFVPGSEVAGTVVAVGPGSRWSIGQRVIGSNVSGAYAERMVVPDRACFAVPPSMSDAAAAALLINYQSALLALTHRAALRPGETLLVHGAAGGVGTASIQLGKALGATVIATAGSDEKLEVCRKAGADRVIDHRHQDVIEVVKTLTRRCGADVIIDPVGGDVFDLSTKCIAWGGRLVVMGFASGRLPTIAANRILLKNISVVGLHWGSYLIHDPALIEAAHARLLELYAAGAIAPVIFGDHRFRQLPQGLDAIAERRSYGKVVVRRP